MQIKTDETISFQRSKNIAIFESRTSEMLHLANIVVNVVVRNRMLILNIFEKVSFRATSKSHFRTREKTLLSWDFREGNLWLTIRCWRTFDFVWEGWTLKCLLLCKRLEFGTFDSEDYIWLTWQSSRHFTRLETCFCGKKNDENLRNCKFQILHFATQLKKFNFDLTKSIQQDEHETNLKRKSQHYLRNRWCCTGTSFEITRFQDLAMFDNPWLAEVSWKRLDFLIP